MLRVRREGQAETTDRRAGPVYTAEILRLGADRVITRRAEDEEIHERHVGSAVFEGVLASGAQRPNSAIGPIRVRCKKLRRREKRAGLRDIVGKDETARG